MAVRGVFLVACEMSSPCGLHFYLGKEIILSAVFSGAAECFSAVGL